MNNEKFSKHFFYRTLKVKMSVWFIEIIVITALVVALVLENI